VVAFEVDSKRYVGSQIGIYNKSGDLVGKPGHPRNTEYLVMAGDKARIKRMMKAVDATRA
jgi:adenine-specific DNA-methyltransferase